MSQLVTREQEVQQRGTTLAKYLSSPAMVKRLSGALPEHMKPERMIRVALTAATRNPRLLDCSPESLGLALLTASQLGLEPNGRDAHLVPYRNTKAGTTDCQLIPDYKGLIQLAYRSGQIDNVSAKAVFERDSFDYELGSNEHLRHIPTEEDEPGDLRYAWAMVRFKSGGAKFVVLNKRDIARRRKSSQTAGRSDGPWQTHTEAMWAKSAVKELAKWMPQTPELERFHKAVEQDDAIEFGGVIDVPSSPVATSKAEDLAGRLREAKQGDGNSAKQETSPELPSTSAEVQEPEQPADGEAAPNPAESWCMDMVQLIADAVGVEQLKDLAHQCDVAKVEKRITERQHDKLLTDIEAKGRAVMPRKPGRPPNNPPRMFGDPTATEAGH